MNQPLIVFVLVCAALPLFGQGQEQMNQAARDEYQKADAELNQLYGQILKDYAKEGAFVQKLRAAQRAWLAFRDAHVDALFPAADKKREYGSVYPLCRYQALTQLTKERTAQLNTWIKGVDETDSCSGSRRSKTAQNRGGSLLASASCSLE
jgi:uncharacterized protein YecT (DUF1311 family)